MTRILKLWVAFEKACKNNYHGHCLDSLTKQLSLLQPETFNVGYPKVVSISPGNLFKMKIIWPQTRSTRSNTHRMGKAFFSRLLQWSQGLLRFEKHCFTLESTTFNASWNGGNRQKSRYMNVALLKSASHPH